MIHEACLSLILPQISGFQETCYHSMFILHMMRKTIAQARRSIIKDSVYRRLCFVSNILRMVSVGLRPYSKRLNWTPRPALLSSVSHSSSSKYFPRASDSSPPAPEPPPPPISFCLARNSSCSSSSSASAT